MAVRIQLRRDSASNWEANNPILALGEIGLDITSGNFKIGNGTDQWTQLNYFSTEVEDVISQEQLDNALAAIGGDGIVFDSEEGIYNLDLSSVSQNIVPETTETYDLGSDTKRWNDLYLSGDTIFLGDIQLKDSGDGKFEVLAGDGETTLETVLLPGQVTDLELSDDAADLKTRFATHRDATNNPHSVTAEQVGLGNVTNESKATMFTDAALTGVPTAPTAAATTNTTQIATTAFVQGEINAAALALGTNYSVADIAARDNLTDLVVGDIVFVADDGDTKWAQYKVTSIGPVVFLKIMDQDVMLNALSAANIKTAYESNANTNAFTDAEQTRLAGLELGVTVQAFDANTVVDANYNNFNPSATYANLRAQATTAGDVGLGNVTNESKATMFTDPTFTGAVTGVTASHVGLGNVTNESKATMFTDPTFTGTVSGVTASMVGLGNVTNESKATMFSNPTFTGVVSGVTKAHVGLANVDDTSDADKPISTATQTALDGKEPANANIQSHIIATDNPHGVTATQIGLGNVTNESKESMFTDPTFTGTVTGVTAAMVGLENVTNESKVTMFTDPTFTGTVSGVTKAHVGLGNVDNTSDADKPISTATQTALDGKEPANANIQSHIASTTNPHNVTATQVGLGNVTNESKATMFTNPTFTGTVSGVTASMVGLGNVTNESKTTMFNNAALTGIPTAPTAASTTNTTQIATTAFVQSEINAASLALGTNYSVADITERDNLTNLVVADIVFVADDGDSKWAQYKVTSIDPVVFLKIMDQDIFLNALSSADVKAAYESNSDTNAFTDALKTRLETIGTSYKVATRNAAEALPNLLIGDIVFITDDGDGKWAQYIVRNILTEEYDFLLIGNQKLIENALTDTAIKTAYERNEDTNAFTDAYLMKLEGIEPDAKDDQSASEVPYNNSFSGLDAVNVQSAIDEVENRLGINETNLTSHINDTGVHFTQASISITESQISDFGTYEPADATILKSADIGVIVQGYNANTVIDANYETFNSSATYANLRAQATTAGDVGLGNVTNESKATMFTNPTFTGTVSGVTASMVGLGNVTNESKATMFTNPDFTGIPTAPTANLGTNTTQIATTAFVQQALDGAQFIDGGEF